MRIFDFYVDDVAFACAAGFLAGALAANFGVSLMVAGFGAATLGAAVAFLVSRPGLWKVTCVASACMVVGLLYFHFFENIAAARTNLVFDKKISFSAVVVNEPAVSASGNFLVVTADVQSPYVGQATILAPADDDIRYGDVLSMDAKITPPDEVGDNPLAVPAEVSVEARGRGFWLIAAMLDFKAAMARSMDGFLSSDAAGFLAAITFSAKEFLTGNVRAMMTSSGTIFLATFYGMKMAVLIFFVSNLLLGYLDRRVIFGVAVVIAVGFAAMADAPVSAIRAAIMVVVALWARENGGILVRRNALAFTAAGMTLWNPAVLTDVGFLASFGSVAGILYLAAPLRNAFHWTTKGFLNWRENVVMNLAAQLAIIPLIADAAGGFPLVSFISGAALIVFLPLTVFAGWATGLASLLVHPVAFAVAPVAEIIAGISIALIRFFAAFPFAVSISWNVWTVSFYYGCLLAFALVFAKKKPHDGFAAPTAQNLDFIDTEWTPAKVGDEIAYVDD